MASTKSFSGALQPKKKSELQEIAAALRISDQGTKDEIQNRIRNHLDKNQTTLEDVPAFAGLFGRRKRSAQPQAPPSRGGDSSDELSTAVRAAVSARRAATLESIRESTPVNDPGEVSTLLKSDIFSPDFDTGPSHDGLILQFGSPGRLLTLPQSPARNLLNTVSRSRVNNIIGVVKRREENVMQSTTEMVLSLRSFLSNSRNIWSLTAVFELIYILYIIIPWKTLELSFSHDMKSFLPTVLLVYPTWSVFRTFEFWSVVGHWAVPSLFIPALFGTIISFHPAISASPPQASPDRQQGQTSLPFDPLTASIIRLAAQIAYPLATFDSNAVVVDVIGFRWRVLSAAVGVAFAFAEAISTISVQFAQKLTSVQQKSRRKSTTEGTTG